MLKHDPLRILLLTSKLSPAAGGLAVSVPVMAHGIDSFADVETHVMGTLDPAAPKAADSWGPRVHGFPTNGPAALQCAPQMALALEELAPDVVDVQGIWTWSSRVSLSYYKRHRKPYVVTPRGMLDPWALRNSAWKKRLFAAFAETSHLRHARCLRATAEMEAQHIRAAGITAPIAIVPNAIDLPTLASRVDQPYRQVLFLSRLHPKKGVTYLLKAWEMLAASFPNWELVIAGIDENGHEAELKRLAERLNLSRIRFVGAAHGEHKQILYRNADLFVLPTHAENFGMVVAEALAQETPVITTTNAPWSGLRDHSCGWWIDLSQANLNAAMRTAMSSPAEVLKEMGQRGRAWVEREFGIEQVAHKMRDLYVWVVGNGPKPDTIHE